jgi:hypothetical protein
MFTALANIYMLKLVSVQGNCSYEIYRHLNCTLNIFYDLFIYFQFEEYDPVTFAIDSMQEDVAFYLVEKGFPFDRYYNVSVWLECF